ncbi:hypothetical protein ACFQL1_16745 [Halomicroarcula sp. GCM10025709]|uniref:DUF7344 domain-containing protein n=1 Tax=Haloarcula TaxID=2237 RepID=UPI0024C35969|nr:hypothetical protein [Halomicroarcula sp. YJ-61-S]
MVDPGEVDELFRALADSRRRVALSRLSTHQDLTLPDLADELAEIEHGRPLTEIDPESVTELYFDLYHSHVPCLVAADLVEYDQAQDHVAITDRGDAAQSELIEQAQALTTH